MVRSLLLALLLGFSFLGSAQRSSSLATPQKKQEIEDSKTFSYGLTTSTQSGLIGGLVFRHSRPVDIRNGKYINRYLALEAVNIQHPKERSLAQFTGTRLAVGKENYFFAIRPEYGREWFLFNKSGDQGIGLSGILAGGPTLGIEKPYYIRYRTDVNRNPEIVAYNADIHNNVGNIVGSAGIWHGLLRDLEFIPGLHAKAALNIDMNTFGDNITGFEAGFTIDVFPRSPVIMAEQFTTNRSVYTAAFLTLYFGNKKVKKLINPSN